MLAVNIFEKKNFYPNNLKRFFSKKALGFFKEFLLL